MYQFYASHITLLSGGTLEETLTVKLALCSSEPAGIGGARAYAI